MKNRLLGAFALCAVVFVANEAEAKATNNQEFVVKNVDELTNACKLATADGNVIKVMPGEYDLTGVFMSAAKHLDCSATLNKGFLLGIGETPEETVLKGGRDINENGVILSFGKSSLIVSNLTFFGGNNSGTSSSGGAIAGSRNYRVYDCVFTNNYAGNFAGAVDQPVQVERCKFFDNSCRVSGGVYRQAGVTPVFIGCHFAGNHSPNGGISYGTGVFSNCTFVGNYSTATYGICRAAGTTTSFTDCYFTNNVAGTTYALSSEGPAYTNCVFYGNSAGTTLIAEGSAIGCELTSNTGMPLVGSCEVRNCVIRRNFGNQANANALLRNNQFYNCLITGNQGGKHSMSAIVSGSSLYNCSVVSNFHQATAYDQHGVVDGGVAVNTIFSGNMTPNGSAWKPWDFAKSGFPAMTNCIWSAMQGTAAKDASVEPQVLPFEGIRFTDPANGDYTLQRKSPAHNAGYQDDDYLALVGPVDLNGDPRVYEGDGPAKAIIDIGCYECQIPAPGLMMLVK